MNSNENKSWVSVRNAHVNNDGTISCKTSGWDGNIHWTGKRTISPIDNKYELWHWIFENRDVFPPLIDEIRAVTASSNLLQMSYLSLPADGVYLLADAFLVESVRAKAPFEVYNPDDQNTSDIWKALKEVTGSNCFVFSGGRCVADLNIAGITTADAVNPKQALRFIRDILKSN